MRSARWALVSGSVVSIAIACGSAGSQKAERAAGGGEAGAEPESGGAPPTTTTPQGGKAGSGSAGTSGTASSAPEAGQGGNVAQTAGAGGAEQVDAGGAGGDIGAAGSGGDSSTETGCVPLKQLGSRIFYSVAPAQDATDGEVRVVSKQGDALVTVGQNPRLSPDGLHLAFQRGLRSATDLSTADLWMRSLEAGTEKSIFSNTDHQVGYFFKDDSTLIYDFGCGQYSMDLSGGNGATLFSTSCYDDAPYLQPGTGKLAYHNDLGLQLRDVSFANPAKLPNSNPGDYWPAWSPDGQWLAFCRYTEASKTCAFQRIASNGESLTHLGDTVMGISAAVSLDGSKVVVGGKKDGAGGLHVFAADGSGYLGQVCGVAGTVQYVGAIRAD